MARITADRVLETTTTTGTGALTLAGAVTGYRTFGSVCVNADTAYYAVWAVDGSGLPTGAWETGLGTWGTGGTLTRTTVHASSNANAAVDFLAGTKRVALTATAAAFPAGDLVGTTQSQTLTGKTIAFASNTLTGVQASLVSGTSIKTVNSTTLLGSGNLAVGTVTSIGITPPAFLSASDAVTGSGNVTLSYSGTALPAANGGTGQTTYTIGDILYASTSSALSKLIAGTADLVLMSNGAGIAPSYRSVSLTTSVTGTLQVGNGGTGATTLTGILKGNGAGAFTAVTAPSGDIVGTTDTQTLSAKTLTNPTITNFVETIHAPAAGSSFTVDLANGTIQKFTTNANTTITLPSSVAGKTYLIMVAYGGAHTITWAGGGTIKWAGGSAPSATAVNAKFDLYAFTCDGTNTYGRDAGRNF